jgi:hypothetical protein
VNVQLLIDAVVRQTMVFIAQLATSGGARAPLAHMANQIFLELARELGSQGVSRKVSADMFGMALRAYVRKVQRLGESSTVRGRTLWEAVFDFVSQESMVRRQDVINRFAKDDPILVRGVLHDLTETGLVFSSGVGASAVFRAATQGEIGRMWQLEQSQVDELVWVIIYREGPATHEALARRMPSHEGALTHALERLVESGRIQRHASGDGPVEYAALGFVVPVGSERGWEAALLDHYHAVVRTLCQKLRDPESRATDVVGGSTYTFAVWPGHPLHDEVLESLVRIRREYSSLRSRVDAHNAEQGVPDSYEQVVVYAGQSVLTQEIYS